MTDDDTIPIVPSKTEADRRRDRWNEQAGNEIERLQYYRQRIRFYGGPPEKIAEADERERQLWIDILVDLVERMDRHAEELEAKERRGG